jgi:hypothetical protein
MWYHRAFLIFIFAIASVTIAAASPPKRTHFDEPSYDSKEFLEASDSPRPQPEAVIDPIVTARELACQPLIIRGFIQAWKATMNGTRNHGLAETGFAIENYKSSISIQGWRDAAANRLSIPEDEYTVAIAHVHGRGADEHPAVMDTYSPVPNFVISQTALYVTLPGTARVIRIRGGVIDVDGWSKPCSSPGESLTARR